MDSFIYFEDWDKKIKYDIYDFPMKKCRYVGCPFSFDIEVTSFYDGEDKRACMYIWQVALGEECIFGRSWEQFIELCKYVVRELDLSEKRKIICYVHNLSYEFQFICHRFEWVHIFSRTIRKVITAECNLGIEFRCSYIMSGYSLSKLAENYTPIEKLKGDLDYNIKRHRYTPLSDEELAYCYNDVKILYHWWKYIEKEYIFQENGNLRKSIKIPLTQTSVVRGYCRNALNDFCKDNRLSFRIYRDMIRECYIIDEYLFRGLQNAYAGGYTHANYIYINKVIGAGCEVDIATGVDGEDFISSYPAMLFDYMPMSRFVRERQLTTEKLHQCIDEYCCLMRVVFYDINAKKYNHILSSSKCIFLSDKYLEDNGRIEYAECVECWMTELDFKSILDFYEYEEIRVLDLYTAVRGYLPKFLVNSMSEFYKAKSELKGVAGKEIEYLHSKENLNSIYGMMVTNPLNDDVEFKDGEWLVHPVDVKDTLINVSNKPSTFLLYQWGVWVTAHARRNLLSCVSELDENVVYCDTDSCKVIHFDECKEVFDDYNEKRVEINRKACEYYNLDFELFKNIGCWDYDGHYDKFCTLGAKKYASNHHITVSGLNSKTAIEYINDCGKDILDMFKIGTEFPCGASGRSVHTYLDDEFSCNLVDVNGIECEVHEYSSIHMEETSYTLGLYKKFSEYLWLKGYRR